MHQPLPAQLMNTRTRLHLPPDENGAARDRSAYDPVTIMLHWIWEHQCRNGTAATQEMVLAQLVSAHHDQKRSGRSESGPCPSADAALALRPRPSRAGTVKLAEVRACSRISGMSTTSNRYRGFRFPAEII